MAQLKSSMKCFGGEQRRYTHVSASLQCTMTFSVFLPSPATATSQAGPVLYWLSGLTCTDENFSTKAGAQRAAAQLGIALVIPDTSPRGASVPADPQGSWDFGHGAGFYLDATAAPWQTHYKMYSYIVQELPKVVEGPILLASKRGISGHSMGGHGALVISMRHPDRYSSCSAFAPIAHPTKCPWGVKAFSNYLGGGEGAWKAYDAVEILRGGVAGKVPTLVDQGTEDPWLKEQLSTDALIAANEESGYGARIRYQEGYEHGYYFVSTFIEEHLQFHADHLK